MDIDNKTNRIFAALSFLIGPILFLVISFSNLDLKSDAKYFLAIFSLVGCLWLFTKVPLFISGILGVTLASLFGIVTPVQAFAPFADPIIFLFLGGFLLAKALEITELDQRLAFKALGHPWTQKSPERITLVFLALSFVLSMWISNTAAVAMLLPLSYGIIKRLKQRFEIDSPAFTEHFLLGLAYCATAGGNVTPIGSPPNVIAIGHLRNLTNNQIGFVQWMVMALPIGLAIFAFIYWRTISHLPKTKVSDRETELGDFKPLNLNQKHVVVIFALTVFCWIFPNLLTIILPENLEFSKYLVNNFSAPVVGVFFASLLFLLPLNSPDKILTGTHTSQIDWPSLLLFGAGLSLGKILFDVGLTHYFTESIPQVAGDVGPTILIIIFLFFTIIFTEFASNTASANIVIPIMIGLAQEMNLSPLVMAFIFAIACNSAYMLPVATPPNTIVYGTQRVEKSTMIKTGVLVNILCVAILGLVVLIFL